MITKEMFIKEIRKQILRIDKGKQDDFNFLGFVEQDDLTPDVMLYFQDVSVSGYIYYNWISGNMNLRYKLKKVNITTKIKDIKKILK